MKKMKYGILALLACSTMTLTGCFNLDEEPYSEITEETFIPTEQDAAALMAKAYTPLRFIYDWYGYFDLQEESGDIIITPARPNGWEDGGVYRAMHQHQWHDQSGQPGNTHWYCFSGINTANRVKSQLDNDELPVGDLKEPMIAELRAIRALWYYMLLDNFGNVPIVTTWSDEVPKQSTRQEVYDFVVKELTEALPSLSDANDGTTYGRMNKWAALALLTRIYLNAEVYTGTAQWAKVVETADQIINSGIFELAKDFSDNFTPEMDYSNNKEVIFAVPYDRLYGGFHQQHKWYPPNARDHFGNYNDYFWGGSCANPQFINAYEEGDKRLEKTWIMGKRYKHDDPSVLVWEAINYLPSLTCMRDGENKTHINWGYRVGKFVYDIETTGGWSNDFAYFRYAEILLSKAEALLRQGKNEDVAAQLVSQIRARVFDDAAQATVTPEDLKADTRIQYGTLDWDNNIDKLGDQTPVYLGGLYDEWGFEFACEAQRRSQMIRFGTFTTKNWFNHEPVGDHVTIFPIPLDELQTNPNLKQNPGY